MTLPFTFYWANEGETTFNPSTMNVFNEDIFSFAIQHDEGQIPTLDIIVKNPRIGLLAPGRKLWAWLAWQGTGAYAGTLVPLFFGVLVGVPTSLFQEKVTLKFIARSPQFIAHKQAVAETMRVVPFYDPVFIDAGKRDDPDTILEGWSALWHIDRTSLAVTASDILVGEDGTITYDEDHAFYDSVSLQLGQPPLMNIRVEASVNWTQRTTGFFTVPPVNLASYTGDTLMSDWPKPGASIGGGYKCEASFVTDNYFISETPNTTYSSSWTNTDPNPGQCSNASASSSSSGPALLSPNPLQGVLTEYYQSGLCFPDSDPPMNVPLESQSSGIIVPMWSVSLDMIIRYDASRQFSEELSFDMLANVQGILASPTVDQNTELLTISGVDVGQPLVIVDAWTDFAGQHVGLAQVIFPNNPTTPGGLSYQIAVGAGTAGTVEPVFSDLPGAITTDSGVLWASLGTQGISQAANWSPGAPVPRGQIMLLQNQVFNNNTGTFENIDGTSYYLCTGAGTTNGIYEDLSYVPPVTSNVEPTPALRHVSFIRQPNFSEITGTIITDGSVIWTVLGISPSLLSIPIGGTPNNVVARSYFPSTRGIASVEYLISRARARLRFRSRAVKLGWECRFEDAVALSCRKNATLFDPRLPGGAGTGKVTSYVLSASGDGKLIGKVEVGCAIGFGDSINEITGTPEYAAPGYAQVGYQIYDGAMEAHGSGDTTFSRPIVGNGFDDGLHFPLRWEDVSDGGRQSGSLAEQKDAITKSFAVARQLQFLNAAGGTIGNGTGTNNTTRGGVPPNVAWQITREQLTLLSQNTPYVMAANPVSWSCLLKPCAGNGPFGGSYAITVSPLVVPQGINLEAPSSP